MAADHTTALFIAQLILMLFCGRLLGELATRLSQPAIFGQLLAGVILGPSVFGAFMPELRHSIFPGTAALKSMIEAMSQIGVLLLLLLTGMETNLSLVNRRRRAVISTSVLGIAVPFGFGVLLAYAMPDSVVPDPAARLVTALFLGTALSISSVKIVAMVLIEVGAIRRDLGQLILATAILDDTIAWIIIAMIAGIATHGTVSVANIGMTLAGTLIFLGLSVTLGRSAIARIIRWSNDYMVIEVPVISAILLVMLVLALSTELLGVHTALGAFIAGVLVGHSPIMTEHIEQELRGFIIAFFSPIFFAVAGLGMDLRTLAEPTLLLLTLAVIVVASLGKFLGALAGGRLGGLTGAESLALATGLNARGSTEVIIASIGLASGALNSQLYTMIVAMAVVTTMAMPPTLRWMLARVPLRDEEAKRLEKEEAEEQDSVPKMERALVFVDGSANGAGAALLAGMFAAQRQILVTVMQKAEAAGGVDIPATGRQILSAAVAAANKNEHASHGESPAPIATMTLNDLVHVKPIETDDTVTIEAAKGYSIIFAGLEHPFAVTAKRFDERLQRLVEAFDGPIAIMLNGTRRASRETALDILVPTGGTPEARLALEIALALAKASNGSLTALHVFDPREDTELLRGRARRQGMSVLVDARRLGKRSDVPVRAITMTNPSPEAAIRRAMRNSRYDLLVIGTSLRQGQTKFLGPRSTALVEMARTPTLLIAR